MKQNHYHCLVLLAGALLLPSATSAEPSATNRLTLSGRFGLNMSGKFKGPASNPSALAGSLPGLAATPRQTPRGDAYNYDDGYVLTDVSGNIGGQTWYWGYDDSTRQIAGNTIQFSRSTASAETSSPLFSSSSSFDSDPSYGAELAYSRIFGGKGKLHYGLEVAANYQEVAFSDSTTFALSRSQSLLRVTDAYPFTPGTTPPTATPSNPYQGSYGGPGFVIGDTAVSSTTTVVSSATVANRLTDQRSFDSDLWGFRLGPCLETPLFKNVDLSLSGGLAVGLLDSTVTWTQTAFPAGGAGASTRRQDSDFDTLWGYYVRANISWQMHRRWSAVGGVQFQDLGTYQHSFAGQAAELNLRNALFVTAGLSYCF